MFKVRHWKILASNCLRRKRECNFTPKEVPDNTYTHNLKCIYLPIFFIIPNGLVQTILVHLEISTLRKYSPR